MNPLSTVHSDQFEEKYPWIFKGQDKKNAETIIYITELMTPLAAMLVGATEQGICLLEFSDRIRIEKEFDDLKKSLNAVMQHGKNQFTDQVQAELSEYFAGSRKAFEVPLHTPGNDFAQSVWKTLQQIPYGTTLSYKKQSEMMNNPKAIRAMASTNGRNRIAIIIPCHRVIGSNGSLTGYAGGIDRKKWLLQFEREHSAPSPGTLF